MPRAASRHAGCDPGAPLDLRTLHAPQLIGKAEQTLAKWRFEKRGPRYVELRGATALYSRERLLTGMKEEELG